jgi:hypothetical protein
MKMSKYLLIAGILVLLSACTRKEVNYDESKVPKYSLPDPLIFESGAPVGTSEEWLSARRPEILSLFEKNVYGHVPQGNIEVKHEIIGLNSHFLNDLATLKQIRITFLSIQDSLCMNLLLIVPNNCDKPVPAFLGLNFEGNHTVHPDTSIIITDAWVANDEETEITDNRATERARGCHLSRWPVEMILDRGFALASVYYGEIDPDFDDGFSNGIHPLFYKKGQKRPEPDEWGSIAAWAWGLSRAMDYLQQDNDIDSRKVAVIGHSRLGKTALWAGATDQRFALIISNNSGCGGAALSRREFGETVKSINTVFPHWFCSNFKTFNNRINKLPVDQHELIALIAPRPVYVASAQEDLWADPKGEFLSCYYADPVYKLLQTAGLPAEAMPELDKPLISGTIGYHIRTGPHDITTWDWQQYLDFADLHFK